MSEIIELIPQAKALINGIRAIGYSFSTAVADIIDNSISAFATNVDIYSDPLDKEPYFCILDNGVGMNEEELLNAMTFGSDRKSKKESPDDLGRFGLGLKSASLSQCRYLLVISKQAELINAMVYDLDLVERENKWILQKLPLEEIQNEPCFTELMKQRSGTLVIWKKFDKLKINAKDFEGKDGIIVEGADGTVVNIYNYAGQLIRSERVSGGTVKIELPQGLYIVNGVKLTVK